MQSAKPAYAKKRGKNITKEKEETTTIAKRNSNQLGRGQNPATLPRNPKKKQSQLMTTDDPSRGWTLEPLRPKRVHSRKIIDYI